MNYPDPASPRYCYPDHVDGEAAAEDYNCNNGFTDMFGDYTTHDLFELLWREGRGGTSELEEPAVSCHPLSPRFSPPSEDEMATWLSAIVNGDEHEDARGGSGRGWKDNNDLCAPSKSSKTSVATKATSMEKDHKLPTAEDSATKATRSEDSSKRWKRTAGAMSHHVETHKLAKRRRCKINERLKTLQHLVPGCDKSSHNSTLEQTIQYMKSLQQQIQALVAGEPSRPATAVQPVVQPQYVPPVTLALMVVLGPLPMVPFGPVLPLPHYPAPVVMMPAAAAATPLYSATPAPRVAVSHRRPLGEDGATACEKD